MLAFKFYLLIGKASEALKQACLCLTMAVNVVNKSNQLNTTNDSSFLRNIVSISTVDASIRASPRISELTERIDMLGPRPCFMAIALLIYGYTKKTTLGYQVSASDINSAYNSYAHQKDIPGIESPNELWAHINELECYGIIEGPWHQRKLVDRRNVGFQVLIGIDDALQCRNILTMHKPSLRLKKQQEDQERKQW